ncbi:MAG: hypothetical protein GY694_12115 [Gammaproteobacteria bacterium]|nr:hypothetical protein [Gammaproteobacteria bacterium]
MSFVGAIGTLIGDFGLSEILEDVFGGVAKMLNGKKFPQNVRALRMVAEELLREFLRKNNFENNNELLKALDQLASESRTAKTWIDVLIKLLMMKFVKAEREGDWFLHLDTFRKMLPYFFAAGHVNYARYGVYYLQTI